MRRESIPPPLVAVVALAGAILGAVVAMPDEPGPEVARAAAASTGDPAKDALIGALVLELELTSALVRAQVVAVEVGKLNDRMTKIETMLALLVWTPTPSLPTSTPTRIATPGPSATPTRTLTRTATPIPVPPTPTRTRTPDPCVIFIGGVPVPRPNCP